MEKLQSEILRILSEDSRFTNAQIATMLNKKEEEISEQISELEKKGVIVKYNTIINYDKLDDERVEAFIEVRVSPQSKNGFDAIAEEIYKMDMVSGVYLMSGAYDLAVTVFGKSLKNVAMFVSEKLSTMDSVLSTATHFILKRYKSDGVIISAKNDKKRTAVSV